MRIIGVDPAISNLSICVIDVDENSENNSREKLASAFPEFRIHYLKRIDIFGGNRRHLIPKKYRDGSRANVPATSIAETVAVMLMSDEFSDLREFVRTSDKIVVEQQLSDTFFAKSGRGNTFTKPGIRQVQASLHGSFVHCGADPKNIESKSSKIKFSTFEPGSRGVVYERTEKGSAGRYKSNKKGALDIVNCALQQEGVHTAHNNEMWYKANKGGAKKDDNADSLGLALAYFVKFVKKVKPPRRKRKIADDVVKVAEAEEEKKQEEDYDPTETDDTEVVE